MPSESAPDGVPSPDARLNYAWGWFQYHASQRLTAFNFFLVLVGLLFVTFAQAINHGWSGVGVAIGVLGSLVSVGFWALDVRNEELILSGHKALQTLEDEAGLRVVPRDGDRDNLSETFGRSPCGTGLFSRWASGGWGASVFRHRTWLRLIMTAAFLMFLAGTIWAGRDFPGASEAERSPPTRKVNQVHLEVGGAIINSTR